MSGRTNDEVLADFKARYPGWSVQIDRLGEILATREKSIDQIKEKFGLIRCYFSPYDKETQGLVSSVEGDSGEICCDCGKPGRVDSWAGYWMLCLCDDCGEKRRNERK